ncbi:hypothetical protein [Brytella acorum]|uniref:Uncharacterized protein n=1 Tax=Brytella acorum TaxID=2959299 RepID=A0AA35Y0M0_9PROT|nr:hypothetical protein [Brytella acorum]MDF3624386.1 hypothetical protein [Brytella acorum]CAI9119764.1 hypothetical protein LMG32879_000589 [Brytella acorum]
MSHVSRRMIPSILALLALASCATGRERDLMERQSPSTLLTSYLIASGMAERHMASRLARHQASEQDISALVAANRNAWMSVRKAILLPSTKNLKDADLGLESLISEAGPGNSGVSTESSEGRAPRATPLVPAN